MKSNTHKTTCFDDGIHALLYATIESRMFVACVWFENAVYGISMPTGTPIKIRDESEIDKLVMWEKKMKTHSWQSMHENIELWSTMCADSELIERKINMRKNSHIAFAPVLSISQYRSSKKRTHTNTHTQRSARLQEAEREQNEKQ